MRAYHSMKERTRYHEMHILHTRYDTMYIAADRAVHCDTGSKQARYNR